VTKILKGGFLLSRKISKKWLPLLLCLLLGAGLVLGCTGQETLPTGDPAAGESEGEGAAAGEGSTLSELTLAVSPGPVSFPVAYLLEQEEENTEKAKINTVDWRTNEQLVSMITNKQVHIAATPIANAIRLYNKGFDIELLSVACWGTLYVVGAEDLPNGLEDLKGQEIGVTDQGGIHDLVFRHLLAQKGIDADKDLNITYLDLPESSAKLATGDLKYAILNEPQASMAIMGAKKNSITLTRVLDLQELWGEATGTEGRIPWAGFVMVKGSGIGDKDAADFYRRYEEACHWVNANPKEAGAIVEKHIEWMKAPAVESGVPFANLQPARGLDCKADIEAFFDELDKTAPEDFLGGKLPDEEFYF
jgi:NitT/TauT family transport system substrate-binding protein